MVRMAVSVLLVTVTTVGMFGCTCGTKAGTAAGVWTELKTEARAPTIDSAAPMVYDSESRTLLLCGQGSSISLMSVSAYDSSAGRWVERGDARDGPAARKGQSWVYDPQIKNAILYGGTGPFGGTLSDIWAYDPASNVWEELDPVGTLPPGRDGQAMVYDQARATMILFGGTLAGTANAGGGPFNLASDMWEYDPETNAWTELHPTGGIPAARCNHTMVYDDDSGQVIMFGGLTNGGVVNDTWAYDPVASVWKEISPSADVPLARSGHSMVYDEDRRLLILFGGDTGGNGVVNDLWAFSFPAGTWSRLDPGGEEPAPRSGHAMAFDPVSGRCVVFGGMGMPVPGQVPVLTDMWAYGPPE
jgi:hypothetical protein